MRAFILAACIAALPTPSTAQEPDGCTYDKCALMVKSGFFRRSLVQGADEAHVASLLFLAPHLDLFAERSDSAARYYRSFHSKHNSGTWLALAGTALFAGAYIVEGESDGVAIGLAIAGAGSIVIGTFRTAAGRNDLARALWWYNRELP